jgi:pimeloyl-ACP methyl ester carboxylesterase
MSQSRPDIHYTRSGGVHIAYTVYGEGPDLIFAPGAASGIEWFWEDPHAKSFLDRLASFSRLIIFDKRGTGRSDPIVGAPTLEERADDIGAVLDAVGSEHAAIFGFSEGGSMGVMYAAAHPERVSALVLWSTAVNGLPDPDDPSKPYFAGMDNAERMLETLRDLARGIYPPLLAAEGLPSALAGQARKASFAVDIESDGVGRYPQDVETAVYFVCLEAFQNASKYAGATRVTVELDQHGDELHFAVADDGAGFDPSCTRQGSGTQNMIDRVEALDGTLTITSAPGAGTRVEGRIPVHTP